MGRSPFHSISVQADVVQKDRVAGNGVGEQPCWLGPEQEAKATTAEAHVSLTGYGLSNLVYSWNQ